MSHNQEFLLECKCDDILGEVLLDQSVDSGEEPIEQVIVMLIEVQPVDSDHTLVCSDRDIFTEVDLNKLQICYSCLCPIPGRPWSSCPTEC